MNERGGQHEDEHYSELDATSSENPMSLFVSENMPKNREGVRRKVHEFLKDKQHILTKAREMEHTVAAKVSSHGTAVIIGSAAVIAGGYGLIKVVDYYKKKKKK